MNNENISFSQDSHKGMYLASSTQLIRIKSLISYKKNNNNTNLKLSRPQNTFVLQTDVTVVQLVYTHSKPQQRDAKLQPWDEPRDATAQMAWLPLRWIWPELRPSARVPQHRECWGWFAPGIWRNLILAQVLTPFFLLLQFSVRVY